MLTGELLRARVSGRTLSPSFIDPERPAHRRRAEHLLDLFGEAVEHAWTRGEVDQAVTDLIGEGQDARIVRGLARLCADRSTFEVASPLSPVELRWKVFSRAREMGPVALEAGVLDRPTASHVLEDVARSLDCTPEQVSDALYADLRDAHRITRCDVASASALLHRYNLALVQALLLRATEVTIVLEGATVPRMRQLLRYVKFHQLIHAAHRHGSGWKLVLDGPLSLFQQSTRYGMSLANFLPALVLQPGPWRLEATVLWTKAKHRKSLVVDSEMGLVSHYTDRGGYEAPEVAGFRERFESRERAWTLDPHPEIVDLNGRAVIVPDFVLRKGDREVLLEIVGFWRRDWLVRRLEDLDRAGPGNLLLAVSRKLVGSKASLEGFEGSVIDFAKVLTPARVIEAAEAL